MPDIEGLPGLNIFIVNAPVKDEEKSLSEQLANRKKEEFMLTVMQQLSTLLNKIPNSSHAGGGV